MSADDKRAATPPRPSATFDEYAIAEIHRAAATGIYDIRGFGAKRKLPHFDDLLFLGASMSRYPLEGYREKCATDVVIGKRRRFHRAADRDRQAGKQRPWHPLDFHAGRALRSGQHRNRRAC